MMSNPRQAFPLPPPAYLPRPPSSPAPSATASPLRARSLAEETAAARIGAEDLFERRFAAARAAVARVEARVNASPRVIAANARQPPSDSDF